MTTTGSSHYLQGRIKLVSNCPSSTPKAERQTPSDRPWPCCHCHHSQARSCTQPQYTLSVYKVTELVGNPCTRCLQVMAGDSPRLASAAPHQKAALWVPARLSGNYLQGCCRDSWWGSQPVGGWAPQAFLMLLATGPRRSSQPGHT